MRLRLLCEHFREHVMARCGRRLPCRRDDDDCALATEVDEAAVVIENDITRVQGFCREGEEIWNVSKKCR